MRSVLTRARHGLVMGSVLGLAVVLGSCGGGGGGGYSGGGGGTPPPATPQATAPAVATSAQQHGATIVSLSSTTAGAAIYYTVDGTTPTAASTKYQAPFLVAANVTVKAIATATGYTTSTVTSQDFAPNIAAGTLVWSDEFDNATGAPAAPNATIWGYDTGNSGFGNHELETYCAATATASPCDSTNPNAYVGTDGSLHIVARNPSSNVFTSARMKTQGLFSFQYGRFEVRARAPEAQGFWPAIWTLGNNIDTTGWPASGEQDILERVNGPLTPDWNKGSVHGTGFTGNDIGSTYNFPAGETAAGWHTYGMIWKPGSVAYYVDDAAHPYTIIATTDLTGHAGAVWPFDNGQSVFLIMNLAVGGDWPGSPDGTTPYPSEMQVDYVRIYTTN